MNVGIYIYNEVEALDFSGPFEVFSTASRVKERMDADLPVLFNIFTIGEKLTPILARGGLKIVPKYSISNHPKIDLLIIPGGIVSDELEKRVKGFQGFFTKDFIIYFNILSISAMSFFSVPRSPFLIK